MKIHFLGIAGSMTSSLAIALKKQGHDISGSDQEKIYPPFSTLLQENGIVVNQPFTGADLTIVGSGFKAFSRCVAEFDLIKKQNLSYISATEYLAKNLIKPESILIAGSYGKTTISAIMAYLLPDANYFFGGQSVDGTPSLQFSDSNWSVVEADESVNGLDTQAKFLYYPVKYLILTSVNWEHKDSYPTPEANFEAFKKLVQKLPPDGVLVYNPHDSQISQLLPFCRAPALPYASQHFDTKLIGEHNQQNLAAAFTLCQYLNLKFDIQNFSGVKRRLEIVSNKNNILVIDDFAQSSDRVTSALQAVSQSYPRRRLFVYFEPHASFLQNIHSLSGFENISPYLFQFVLGKIKFSPDKNSRVSAADWRRIVGEKFTYIPINSDIIRFFKANLQPNDILIHFSSGGLEGLTALKTVYNNN